MSLILVLYVASPFLFKLISRKDGALYAFGVIIAIMALSKTVGGAIQQMMW